MGVGSVRVLARDDAKSMLITYYLLPITYYLLPITYYPLPITYSPL
jgi:predicted CDP-diglyceride synthetase/phosphatidate cytidylyltransferase